MTDLAKRKLSAKQIVEDIRSGMDGTGLKRKYGLSDTALQSLCTKLLSAGALTENEIKQLMPLRDWAEESHQGPTKALWHCPACNTPQVTEMAECPACGVIVEKFVARSERDDHVLSTAIPVSEDTARTDRTNWMPIIISIAVFVIAGSSLLLWSTHKANQAHEISEDVGTESVQVADTEADQTEEDSGEELESNPKKYSEVEIENPKDDIVLLKPPPVATPDKNRDPAVSSPRERTPSPREETSPPREETSPPREETSPPREETSPPREETSPPREETSPPREETSPTPEKPLYITGVLRQFSSSDFKREVVEASKTYPVLFQFYSQT